MTPCEDPRFQLLPIARGSGVTTIFGHAAFEFGVMRGLVEATAVARTLPPCARSKGQPESLLARAGAGGMVRPMHTVTIEAGRDRPAGGRESPTDFIVRELAALAARRILEMPSRVQEGIARLARWRIRAAGGGRDAAFAEWEDIIRSRTAPEIAGLLLAEGGEAQRLRSSMPFFDRYALYSAVAVRSSATILRMLAPWV